MLIIVSSPQGAKYLRRGAWSVNVISLLTPKAQVAYLYDDFTVRQGLEKLPGPRLYRYPRPGSGRQLCGYGQ